MGNGSDVVWGIFLFASVQKWKWELKQNCEGREINTALGITKMQFPIIYQEE